MCAFLPPQFAEAPVLQALNDVRAAVPVCVHVPAATPSRFDHELLRLAEPLVEVELDPVSVDAAERPLTRLARDLEESQGAVAAGRSLGPHIQLSPLLLDEPDRLGRRFHTHLTNGTTVPFESLPTLVVAEEPKSDTREIIRVVANGWGSQVRQVARHAVRLARQASPDAERPARVPPGRAQSPRRGSSETAAEARA
jgi:hypothetical protein